MLFADEQLQEILLQSPVSSTTYLPVQVCYQVRVVADEQRIQIRPKSSAGGLQYYQLRDLEETLQLPEAIPSTVKNVSRSSLSLSRRFSQRIRWSWRPKAGDEEDEEPKVVNENLSTEMVKRSR